MLARPALAFILALATLACVDLTRPPSLVVPVDGADGPDLAPDASTGDAASDRPEMASPDAGVEGAARAPDALPDTAAGVFDAADSRPDTPPDAPVDLGPDLPPDRGAPDAPLDSAPDASFPTFDETCSPPAVYVDDFSTDPSARWRRILGTWQWDQAAGVYRTTQGSPAVAWPGPRAGWRDYVLEVRLRADAWLGPTSNGGISFRVQPAAGAPEPAMYYVGLAVYNQVMLGTIDGTWTSLARDDLAVTAGTWYRLRIELAGNAIRVYVDDVLRITYTDASARFPSGPPALRAFNTAMTYDDLRVTCR